MASDALQSFLFSTPVSGANGGPSGREVIEGLPDTGPVNPDSIGDAFVAGLRSGGESLGADVEYFKALFNTATGDQEAAETNVRRARIKEAQAAIPVSTMETFS